MQSAVAVSQEVLESYIGGVIVHENNNGVSTLVRGTLLDAKINNQWVEATITCDEHASGTIDTYERASWKRSPGNASPIILRESAQIDENGNLVFYERSPQGSIAVIHRRR